MWPVVQSAAETTDDSKPISVARATKLLQEESGIRLDQWSSVLSPSPIQVAYQYDAAGNVIGMTMPSSWQISYQRDALGRVSGVTALPPGAASSQTIASSVTWYPFGQIKNLALPNGVVQTFTVDTDYRVTTVTSRVPPNGVFVTNRSLTWMGENLTAIDDNQFPGFTPSGGVYGMQSQTFAYTPAHRLQSATGYYGSLSWTYDAVGNRTSATVTSGTPPTLVTSTYAYPATSNRLSSITTGGAVRSFGYDASGNITSDSSANVASTGVAMTYAYDSMSIRWCLTHDFRGSGSSLRQASLTTGTGITTRRSRDTRDRTRTA